MDTHSTLYESVSSISVDMDVEDNSEYFETRLTKLGFKPQREIVFNNLLPYSDKLDEESQILLKDIKGNLGKCVLLKELNPGCVMWSVRLRKYIQIFGLKFSKDDHITFIKLLYELMTIPNLEPQLISRFSVCLSSLLKKKTFISREELILPWKLIYDVCDRLFRSSNSSIGMYRFSPYLENVLTDVISSVREYFEPTATEEILKMWRPKLCPLDSNGMQDAIEVFDSFLPTLFLPQERAIGYELWFDEFMDLWKTCHNSPNWETSMMSLMSRLAIHNIGLIDWEPHMALMYSRILRSFSLPVNYKKTKVHKNHKLSVNTIAMWIVSTLLRMATAANNSLPSSPVSLVASLKATAENAIDNLCCGMLSILFVLVSLCREEGAIKGGGSSSQNHLHKMMKVLESYLHPANNGVWVMRLREFLRKLPHYFMIRLSNERHPKKSWIPKVPEHARLTEQDITAFVESMTPTVTLAVYSRIPNEINSSLQYLATLRPNIVIPPIIESMYNTLDSLTEPHKYTATMLSLISVARPMIESNDYKIGPTHVIPLLMAVLPGIDPNDVRKCFITFQVITTFASMIPLVDSSNASEYWKDLTEEEEIVSAASSQLEDFVLEFLDRCFTLVDNSVMENTRLEQHDQTNQQRSRMEHVAESAIVSTFTCLLCQTSPQIFQSALRKFHTFATSRILETTVSGRCVASICRVFAKVRPEETLKLLLPHFSKIILSYAEHENIAQEEKLDNELLYNLLLLSEVVNCYGRDVIIYKELLEKVLDHTLHLKCTEGHMLASKLLTNILSAMAAIRPQEFKSSNQDYGKHISEFFPVREWGKPFQAQDVKVEWYTPSDVEVSYAQHLISKYLCCEFESLNAYSAGTLELTRTELQCSLGIISAFRGCGRLLPIWDEPPINYTDTCSEMKNFYLQSAYIGKVSMPDGSNVRKAIASVMAKVQAKLLSSAEDDTKSLNCIANILGGLLLNMMPSAEEVDTQAKAFMIGKKIFENKMLGRKRHIRSVLLNKAYHQHEIILTLSSVVPTKTHKDILSLLFDLSISHYSEVRKIAQGKLNSTTTHIRDVSFVLLPRILKVLKQDSNLFHEQFKGVLYVLLGPKDCPLIARNNWKLIKEFWPALINAQPSEKPSIINLLNSISDTVLRLFPTITINSQMTNNGEATSRLLWSYSKPSPELPQPVDVEIDEAKRQLAIRSEERKADYLKLLDTILKSINSNLHWRFHRLALGFFQDLVHPDLDYPPQIVQNILQTLIHDNIEFRKIAIRCTIFILKQQKRCHKYQIRPVEHSSTLTYGDRDDNQWLQYNSSTVPRSQSEWDEPRYAHKHYVGYYTWDIEVKVCSPSSEQPPLDRSREEFSPGELEVDNFFSDVLKLDKLISFLSLEGKKGQDKFDGLKFLLFKNLFRNFGDRHLDLFKPHLEKMIADKHESSQRCAAEIISGLVRGAKHWPFEKVEKMWLYLIPQLKVAFSNMTVETVLDWSVMAATASENRDPNRHHWLLEFLMEDPLREEASFIDCGRLCALQGALNQQEWRVVEFFNRLLEYLRPKLSHPYQLIRERVGSVLTNIFAPDLPTSGARKTRGPLISHFVKGVMPQLLCLYSLSQNQVSGNNEESSNSMEVDKPDKFVDNNGKNEAICLFKTMVKWITNSIVRADFSIIPEFLVFLPLVCLMENYESDEELNKICTEMLAAMAQSLILPEFIPTALNAIQEVSEMSSWSARSTCLDFMQVFVFHNMSTISIHEPWVVQLNSLVLRLLKDERVEVREKAGQVLSGLIHCGFITDKTSLMNDLKRLASKQKKSGLNEIVKRHAGVLGLCAFISANPYDVIDPVPEIFLLLGSHLNDPQPIPSSIRKTLGDFKRTHHDNWEQHKLKFTEEQLAVLTDLIVPPSYYA